MQNWFLPVTPIPGSFVTNMLEPLLNTRPFSEVTKEEIDKALKTTSNTSAPGLSGLNYQVLKWARLMYPEVFDQLIAKSISLGFQHPLWKHSIIITFAKPNKPAYNVPKSYQPIQLLECMGKVVEKIVASRLLFDVGKYNLLPTTQFGGRPHSSCLDAGLALVHNISTARKGGMVSTLLTLDIKGFFDHVQHGQLIWVLWHMDFPLQICSWVLSFISDCSTSLNIDNALSDFFSIDVGVPQGSPVSLVLACYTQPNHFTS